jgi:hypothetical protein
MVYAADAKKDFTTFMEFAPTLRAALELLIFQMVESHALHVPPNFSSSLTKEHKNVSVKKDFLTSNLMDHCPNVKLYAETE